MFDMIDLYMRLAALCFVLAVTFFFITTECLIKGKLKLPSWVFSSFTLVIGVYFFNVFLRSMNEFTVGRTDALDELLDIWGTALRFIGLGHLV